MKVYFKEYEMKSDQNNIDGYSSLCREGECIAANLEEAVFYSKLPKGSIQRKKTYMDDGSIVIQKGDNHFIKTSVNYEKETTAFNLKSYEIEEVYNGKEEKSREVFVLDGKKFGLVIDSDYNHIKIDIKDEDGKVEKTAYCNLDKKSINNTEVTRFGSKRKHTMHGDYMYLHNNPVYKINQVTQNIVNAIFGEWSKSIFDHLKEIKPDITDIVFDKVSFIDLPSTEKDLKYFARPDVEVKELLFESENYSILITLKYKVDGGYLKITEFEENKKVHYIFDDKLYKFENFLRKEEIVTLPLNEQPVSIVRHFQLKGNASFELFRTDVTMYFDEKRTLIHKYFEMYENEDYGNIISGGESYLGPRYDF